MRDTEDVFQGCRALTTTSKIEMGCALQRLFSTFPNSWPGLGLLLLRICLAIALIYLGVTGLSSGSSEPITFAQDLIAAIGGVFLLAGLWTPVAGTLVALDKVWAALSPFAPQRAETWVRIFLAVLAASMAMLGPGAWSIDARLFGRKRFDIDRTRAKRQ